MASVWELIKDGKFAAACEAADAEMVRTNSLLPSRNKITALLNLEEYEEAVILSKSVIEKTKGDTDTDFIFLGVAHWLQGHKNRAIEAWRQATDSNYTDAAGGVEAPLLLFYAAQRCGLEDLREESLQMLKKLCNPTSETTWPGPLAFYVLGYMDERTMREKISPQPILAAKQTCQALFYVGITNLVNGETSGFNAMMQEVTSHVPFGLLKSEFYLARNEIKKIPSGGAASPF